MTQSAPPSAPTSTAAPANSRAAAAAARRQQLLEVAEQLFLESGYGKTSVSRIVKTAGVAQGTFYLYFASKEAILLELRRGVLRRLRRAFKGAALGDEPADERLVAAFGAVSREVVRNVPLLRQFRSAETAVQTEQVVLDGRQSMAAPIAALIREGADRGDFTVDSVDIAAHVALSLFSDLVYTAAAYGEPAPTDVLVPATTRMLLRALGVSSARVDTLLPPESP